jgi:hypothetical protein
MIGVFAGCAIKKAPENRAFLLQFVAKGLLLFVACFNVFQHLQILFCG